MMLKTMMMVALMASAAVAVPVVAADVAVTERGKDGPVLGSFGVDTTGMDASVKPGDNFFDHVNGQWVKNTPIPDDRSRWGMFDELRDLSQVRTRAILDEVMADSTATGNARKIGDFYATLMDEAAIEAAGLAPIRPQLEAIAGMGTPAELSAAFGRALQVGGPSPLRVGVNQDLKDPTRMSASLWQSGLGMPNRDYYLEERFAETRAEYEAHVARMLMLAGVEQADARAAAARILALETDIARAHWTNVENRQAEKRYNPVMVAALDGQFPGMDWGAFRAAAGVEGEERLIVSQPSAAVGISKLVAGAPMEAWRDWMTYHTLREAATGLPRAFRDEAFAFYGKTLSGTPQQEERWKQASDATTAALGEAIGEIYVARHFPPEAKAQMDALVANIIKAMDARLAGLEWMAPETRVAARAKLAKFKPKIGYPDQWRDYSALEVKRGDAVGNLQRSAAFGYQRQIDKLGKPIDRSEWFMTPMTVNAYANPVWNEIVFPAAILQAPFFDPKADPAVNYGGIGAVIGHEILHHFDDQGRKYDPDGKLSDWWTPGDVERFTALTDRLVAQVETYEPLPGKRINGKLSLGENIADIAGLNVAWDAYQMSLNGKPAPVIDGKSGPERFYLGFGQIWRSKYREAAMERQLTVGPHSPSNYRPLTARNHDAWYETFGVKPGDALYLAPEERVKIW